MIDFAALNNQTAAPLAAAGRYFVIRCTPDPFTSEMLNVGVCVIDPSGKRHIKVITEPGRLECLYGVNGGHVVVSMANIAGACALNGGPPPSEQIIFSDPLPFYNATPVAMLEAVFAEQVTVALPKRHEKTKKTVDDAGALRMVSDDIKKMLGLDAYFLAEDQHVIINTEKGARTVHVPLLPTRGAGTIKSADYSEQTLKSHLMDSLLDIECAGRHCKKDRLGLFILRPQRPSVKQAAAIDAVIDSIAFRAPSNLRIEATDSSEELAWQIRDWAEVT